MTTSTDLATALETFIREEVQRQLAAALAELEPTPAPVTPAAPPQPRSWLSTAQAAARAGRHPRTIADACRSGDLLATQRGPQGSWRVDPAALDAWIRGVPEHSVPGWAASGADPEPPRYLDTAGAAAYAGKSRDTILKACQSGALFATQRVKGGGWSIRPTSVDAWLHGVPDPHREQVERWKRGPKQPLRPRKALRTKAPQTDPEGPAAA